LWAGLVGIVLIIALVWYMYGFRKAVVTLASLTMFLLALLALVKLIDYAMSLSAIAAIILSIGMGVDANILIYERVREELKAGKTI
jgi:preprotein translocase subunit SecD